LQEVVQKQLSQERAAREVQQETLRVYLAQDRGQRETPINQLRDRMDALEQWRGALSKEHITRVEYDSSMRRVWEVVDSHSYSMAMKKTETFVQAPITTVQMPSVAAGTKTMVYLPPSGPLTQKIPERLLDIPGSSVVSSPGQVMTTQLAGSTSYATLRPAAAMSSWVPGTMVQSVSMPSSLSVDPGLVVETRREIREESPGVVSTMPMTSTGAPERSQSPMSPAVTFKETVEQIEEVRTIVPPATFVRTLSPMRSSQQGFATGPAGIVMEQVSATFMEQEAS
jgi:hypothetical protein